MFTGLVEELGVVATVVRKGRKTPTLQLTVKGPLVARDAKIGDSIAINGCCLTVVGKSKGLLTFEAGEETLSRTNLGRLSRGSQVNLERSLAVGDRLGGHLVAGHVDGVGRILDMRGDGESRRFMVEAPGQLARYIASKGSVALDGISLTVNEVALNRFGINIIPHSAAHTTFADVETGRWLNVEIDILARYLGRMLEARASRV